AVAIEIEKTYGHSFADVPCDAGAYGNIAKRAVAVVVIEAVRKPVVVFRMAIRPHATDRARMFLLRIPCAVVDHAHIQPATLSIVKPARRNRPGLSDSGLSAQPGPGSYVFNDSV